LNLSLILEMSATAAPDDVALVCDGHVQSYDELWTASCGAARWIRDSKADFVGLLDESSAASVVALFGAALAGVPYCPLNYRLPDADLAQLVARITPGLLIGDDERLARLNPSTGNLLLSREAFLSQAQAYSPGTTVDIPETDAVAVQLFTSGTTAAPKAAILRHSNLLSYIFGTLEFGSAQKDEASIVSVPPYHIAGISAILSSIYTRRRIVMLPAFSPADWLRLAIAERVTNAFLVPTMLSRIVGESEKAKSLDLSHLKAIAYGGGKMPLEIIVKALQLFPHAEFTNAYGLTETSSTIALLGPEDHRAAIESDDPKVRSRLTSVGRPLPTIDLEIRGEDGQALVAGQTGEVFVKGDQVSGEYRERKAVQADGWFPTRDAGWLDEDGYLYLSGRIDDVIVRGGENMSPGEIEDVVMTHGAIADSCALGIPSVEWGEAVGLAVVIKDGHVAPSEDELKSLVRSRLRSSRVPERVLFLTELPYNETGKLLRREVRKHFESQ
jgi:acyl-CoA synthetase (AMP-forming)/AMP-acid ligase II